MRVSAACLPAEGRARAQARGCGGRGCGARGEGPEMSGQVGAEGGAFGAERALDFMPSEIRSVWRPSAL